MIAKIRKTLTLDSDVVKAFMSDDPDNFSGTVNDVLREEMDRRRKRASLQLLVDDMIAIYGMPTQEQLDEAERDIRGELQ